MIVGLLWLVAAGAEEDGGPSTGLFWLFGSWYIGLRVMKQLAREPMSVLPAFGILLGSGGLIWLGIIHALIANAAGIADAGQLGTNPAIAGA